ncbi:MAG: hypothetical protein ACOYXT_06600 [Bacteroidota bacterium]
MTTRIFLIVAALSFLSMDRPKLVKTKVAEGITVSVPKGWRPMDNLDFTERYPSVRAPIAAFTNEERMADLSVNISATQWPDANPDMARQFFKASLVNMFDKVDIIQEGIRDIKGKKFIYFEFESRVNGNRRQEGLQEEVSKYSYIQYLVEPKRTLVFSFSCPRREREQWQATAKAIMESVRVK